jgi:3-isopropylmalate dehydrogenase
MLDFLDEGDAAGRIRSACADPVTGSTTDVGDAIAARVGN